MCVCVCEQNNEGLYINESRPRYDSHHHHHQGEASVERNRHGLSLTLQPSLFPLHLIYVNREHLGTLHGTTNPPPTLCDIT